MEWARWLDMRFGYIWISLLIEMISLLILYVCLCISYKIFMISMLLICDIFWMNARDQDPFIKAAG